MKSFKPLDWHTLQTAGVSLLMGGLVLIALKWQWGDFGDFKYFREAIEAGDTARVSQLLSEGKDPDDQQGPWGSSLQYAIRNDRPEIATLLINHGADPGVPDSNDQTPLHEAANAGDLAIVLQLLEAGADPAFQKGDGGKAVERAYWQLAEAKKLPAGSYMYRVRPEDGVPIESCIAELEMVISLLENWDSRNDVGSTHAITPQDSSPSGN